MDYPLPALGSAVRTGDTPPAERQRLVRHPPQVLITTPESLHLMLTSRARDTLRNIEYCIVDEIHALCTSKRGVFLALLLERLAALNPRGFVRIGLSATQRPLDEVARFLAGALDPPRIPRRARKRAGEADDVEAELHDEFGDAGTARDFRPVTIVDAGYGPPVAGSRGIRASRRQTPGQ